ncbi:AP-5 complex subunit zeta-1 [Gadus morhua]|uniref:AP-5 complex subunit zeta-1 n=1 Tax=Gadus morhua TaxID=8049 RepID=UPI0011B8376D|nr:AP-5 complex subunit zeta-1 [Gadus morhua]
MYSHGSESLLKQARDIQDAEMAKFCSRMVKQTQARDQGPQGLQGRDQGLEAVDSLQRLHLILAASGRAQSLPSELHQRLLALLLSSSGEQLQVLCAAVLRETAPPSDHKLNYSQCSGGRLNSHALGLLVTQVSKEDLPSLCGLLLQSLEAPEGPAHSRAPEGPPHSLTHTLPALAAIISHSPDCLTEDHVTLLNKKLIDWLRYASTQQGGGASSVGFFNGPRIRQPGPVTELDGGPSGDFFTVLCVAQGFTEDQWMNAHAFSLLRPWLLASSAAPGDSSAEADPLSLSSPPAGCRLQLSLSHSFSHCTDDRSDVDGSVVSMVSATSSSSRLLAPRERLREKSFLYAQRLIEQSDRKALKRADSELQKACLVEAVLILDQVCLEDVSQVFRAFPAVKALYGRLSPELGAARVLLAVAQFYLNHGETAAVDCEPVWRLVFGRLPAELFNDPHLAHSLLRFTRLHLHHLQPRVVQYTQAFPNLLKFLAWDSPAVLEDFVDLLPSLVTPGTAVELLHSLLDLPCLSATLVLQLRCLALSAAGGRAQLSLEAFRSPAHRGLFLFLLRAEAGSGDTIARLATLHRLLAEAADWPRVVQAAQAVPVLLHVYFNAVVTVANEKLLSQLVSVLLERSSLLFNIPTFIKEIHRVLSFHLLRFCKLRPSLVVDQSHELLEFAGTTANAFSKEAVFTDVVWLLGEVLSGGSDPRCSVELITSCFESLEAVLFEVTSSAPPPGEEPVAPRVITSLMSALAKLASRSHDLIPRVSLFLSKLRAAARGGAVVWSREEDLVAIVTRGEELCSLLRLPGVAQSVLTPPPRGPRWHRDLNVAPSLQLRALSGLALLH